MKKNIKSTIAAVLTGALLMTTGIFGSAMTVFAEADTTAEETAVEETVEESAEESPEEESDPIFMLYISGIDNRGEIIEKSRSDTNIVIVANKDTKQAVLISTPRDYYVPLSISNGVKDKLTHSGVYGVQVSVDTMAMLYDIELENYLKLNFGGFIDIIDEIGGITLYSDYTFDSKNMPGYHFDEGYNNVSGEAALAFARERYSYASGDRQRGKNQMEVIKAVINQMQNVDISEYPTLLKNLSDCYATNLTFADILELLNSGMLTGGEWNIVSYSVDGTGSSQTTYSMNQYLYVMIPDESTVNHAKELIAKVQAGEILTQE